MSLDLAALLTELLSALNSASTDDLVWWSEADLYQWMDEGLKRLSRTTGMFVDYDAASGGFPSEIPLPAGVELVIHLAWNFLSLRAATVRELEGLDASWILATGHPPTRWTQDLGAGQIRLYPTPNGDGTIERVSRVFPPAIDTGQTALRATPGVVNYLYDYVLAEARAVEGEPGMPESSAACRAECLLLEQIFTSYYGGGE